MKIRLAFFCLLAMTLPSSAADSVFHPDHIPAVAVAPGVALKELIGRLASAKSDHYSVAQFTLASGATTGFSLMRSSEESFLIVSGKGHVVLGKKRTPVRAGSVVVIREKMSHALFADAGETLVFYAICAPAFDLKDYVLEKK